MSQERADIAIITDSTSDLPEETLARHGITVVPLYILWGGEQLREGVDIDHETFYRRIEGDPEHPSTSQPTPADFVRAIEATRAGQVVIVTISSALSGTYNSATAAREHFRFPIRVIDSRSVSMGLGWQVLAAARARDEGQDLDGIVAAARRARESVRTYFTVATLEYLHRGGRIGGAARLLGTALQLKPLLAVDTGTGRIEAVERTRTRKRALARVVEIALQGLDRDRPLRVAAMHAAARADAEHLAAEVRSAATVEELLIRELTPVLGTHGGPGLVGLAVLPT